MLMRWDPFVGMNRYHDPFFRAAFAPVGARRPVAVARPAVDVRETEAAYAISLEVPGIPREAISVEIDGQELTVRGERKVAEDESKSDRRVERFRGSFARRFSLPEDADADSIEATLHDGVLELNVPKRAKKAARNIEVKAA